MNMIVAIDRTPKHAKDRRARRILGRYGWRVAPRTWLVTSEAAVKCIESEARRQLSDDASILLIRTRGSADSIFERMVITAEKEDSSRKVSAPES